jgi:CubicO group peptidase (beta-lactamase class C family)
MTEDLLKYSLNLPLDHAPGTQWTYNNCALMVLDPIFSSTTGMDLRDFARERLFEPIGMHSVAWLTDGNGDPYAFIGIHATARDMARFGYLFLRDGLWEEREILPRDWVTLTTKPYSDLNPAYGYLWWVNGYAKDWKPMEGVPTSPFPRTGYWFGDVAPPDSYAAMGAFGQMIAVIPELELVMVRTGKSELYDPQKVFTLLYETVTPEPDKS